MAGGVVCRQQRTAEWAMSARMERPHNRRMRWGIRCHSREALCSCSRSMVLLMVIFLQGAKQLSTLTHLTRCADAS